MNDVAEYKCILLKVLGGPAKWQSVCSCNAHMTYNDNLFGRWYHVLC